MDQYIDNTWFERLSECSRFSLVGRFMQNTEQRVEQKKLFLNNEIRNPHFTYPKLINFDTVRVRKQLMALYAEIDQEEKIDFVRNAYKNVIEERIAHLDILSATQNGDFQAFQKLNESEFGHVSVDIVAKLMPHVLDMIQQAKNSDNALSSNAAMRLEKEFATFPINKEHAIFTTFTPNETPSLNAHQIAEAFNGALNDYKVVDWNITIDNLNLNPSIRIDHNRRKILIPKSRRVGTRHLNALIKHEIGIHILRRQNAENGNFRLLTIGLDHYMRGDEGLAKYSEYEVLPSAFNTTIETYLGIALITGLGGFKMDFRDIFNIFCDYYLASSYNKSNLSKKKAEHYAWSRANKLFRGTDGKQVGICFMKDLVYLHGYLDILKTLSLDPNEENRFLQGKYDPANQSHISILNKWNIYIAINNTSYQIKKSSLTV